MDDDIEKSINYYLGKNEDNSDIVTTSWKNDGRVYDESFNPLSLEMLDSDGKLVTKALDYDKDYKIRLTVDVKKPDSNVDFWLEIYVGSERISVIGMPEPAQYKTGNNIFDFYLPKQSFLPNDYVFSLGASLKNTKWIANPSAYDITARASIKKSGQPVFSCKVV